MKFFSLIEEKHLHLAPKRKIVPKKAFAKLLEAKEIVEAAERDALNYRTHVSKECEALKEQREKEGFEQGQGAWSQQIHYLEKEISEVRQEMANALIPLALAAVKKIIGRELEIDPTTIVDIVATALKSVAQHRRIVIYVQPSDIEILEKERPALKKICEHLESLSILPREDITSGGCIIETEAGIINAQLDMQLHALEAAFRDFLKGQLQGVEG